MFESTQPITQPHFNGVGNLPCIRPQGTSNCLSKEDNKHSIPIEIPRGPTQHHWSPYSDNGGSVIALAGKGFAVVAADTRLSQGYTILSREDESKTFDLAPRTILASAGMQADRIALQQQLTFRLQWYEYNNRSKAGTRAVAQMLSNHLYYRRFFPLYTFNVLAGLDESGNGVCFSYDAVGSTEPMDYGAAGSGNALIVPLLDLYMRKANINDHSNQPIVTSKEDAISMVKEAFTSAGEREIHTGDAVIIKIITPEGIFTELFELKKD